MEFNLEYVFVVLGFVISVFIYRYYMNPPKIDIKSITLIPKISKYYA